MKVVITGMGAVTAAGAGVPRFIHATDGWRTVLAPGVRFAAPGLPVLPVGEVPENAGSGEPGDDRAVWIALPAVVEALRAAGIRPGDAARRVDLFYVGTSLGGMTTAQALHREVVAAAAAPAVAPAVAPPGTEPKWLQAGYHGPATTIAARLHLRAQVATYNAACSSGLVALRHACERIRRGEAQVALVGGVDALCSFVYAGFHALGALATGLSAPYDMASTGITLAEGAGFLVVESEESAEERGASPLAEVLGVAVTHDAWRVISTHPEGRGFRSALEGALAEAALSASALGLVVGHGVGAPQGDFAELRALASVLGGERTLADRVPLTSWKGALGHPLAASGPLSIVRAIAAGRQRRVPPVIGLRHPLATFPVRLPKEPEPIGSPHAAVLTAGLGGQAAAAVLRVLTSVRGEPAEHAPARSRPSRSARPLRMMRDEVLICGAAVVTHQERAGFSLAEFERLNPTLSLRHLPDEGQLAFVAVREAMRAAGELLPPNDDVGLVCGVGLETMAASARFGRTLLDAASGPPSPGLFVFTAANAIPSAVAAVYGFRGPHAVASSGTFASAQALLDAALMLAEGLARRVVVLGFVPRPDDVAAAFARAGVSVAAATDGSAVELPVAAALVLGRVEGEEGMRLELRRRKRSSVTPPTAPLTLDPLLGADAIVRIARIVAAARAGAPASASLRTLDRCTGAALWLRVSPACLPRSRR